MASTATAESPAPQEREAGEVSLSRLYLMRAMYLLLVIGIGAMVIPELLFHQPASRGVMPAMFGALGLLSFLGLRYPLEMVPLLLFELAWKAIWMVNYGLPQYVSGQRPPTFSDDFFNIALGGLLLVVIPWDYVWRRFVTRTGARWK